MNKGLFSKIMTFLLFALPCMPGTAQLRDGIYHAFQVVKEDQQPDVITIRVLTIGKNPGQFSDDVTQKVLDGEYHIVVDRSRYVVGNFKKGIVHGDWTQYWENEVEEKKAFKNGKPDGFFMSKTSEGHDEYTFKEGICLHFKSWYKNGQLEQERKYDENGKVNGEVIVYNNNGSIKHRFNYLHGEKDGPQMETDGYIETYTIKNGKKIGEYSRTDRDGHIYEKGTFDPNGKKTGKWLFGNSRQIDNEEDYLDGLLHGEKKQYYSDGELWIYEEYVAGKQNGKSIEYDDKPNRPNREGNYKNDLRHGEFRFYFNGEIYSSELYKEGKLVMEKKYYEGKLTAVKLLDETGHLVEVEGYNSAGKKTYKNTTFKKHPSIKLKEDASGVIDIEIE